MNSYPSYTSVADVDRHRKDRKPLFELGEIVITQEADEVVGGRLPLVHLMLDSHVHGNWGMSNKEDGLVNDRALVHGFRILSAYKVPDKRTNAKHTVFVATHDVDDKGRRQLTTIFLPHEY